MKKEEPVSRIANRHYAQSSTAAKRREQTGLEDKPRRWKKGQGTYAKLRKTPWSPFEADGTMDMARLEREGFTRVGALIHKDDPTYPKTQEQSDTILMADAPGFPKIIKNDKKLDVTQWMDEQADAAMKKEPIILESFDDESA